MNCLDVKAQITFVSKGFFTRITYVTFWLFIDFDLDELMHFSGGTKKKWKVLDTYFMLPPKYELIEVIGKGAYGIVVAAKDTSLPENDNLVAIKK